MTDLRSRLPKRQDILAVLGVITLVVYSWTLYRLAYFLPGWINAMTFGEILAVACYGFLVDMFESGLFLAALLLLAFVLPTRLMGDKFVPQAVLIVLVFAVLAVYLQENIALFYEWQPQQFRAALVAALLLIVLIFFLAWIIARRIGVIEKALSALAERTTIFLYLYIPVSLLSLVIVIVLNL